ncbi:MAG: NAD-dependent epimerase/dehydratase family protein, partial [Bacteroidota bacterium]
MKKVLVTGATGFFGQHLIKRLLQENISVRALYRDEKKRSAISLPTENIEW